MSTIVVFDSGLGSLSIVNAIQRVSKCDIVYFADTKSHPYGTKPPDVICGIVRRTIQNLRALFKPKIVVVGSNTPTLLCGIEDSNTIGVWPPLIQASRLSQNNTVTVLATKAIVQGGSIEKYAKSLGLSIRIRKVDASDLIHLVESGRFQREKSETYNTIQETLQNVEGICTLSSTHLPFLRDMMEKVRPDITFVDPANVVAQRVIDRVGDDTGNNSLQVWTSGGHSITPQLRQLGIKEDVRTLLFENRG